MHADETTADAVGSDMRWAMRVRVVEAERTVFLTGSVGLALTSGNDITGLLSDADTAMHAAKESGRDRFVPLDAERRAATPDRRGMLAHLRAFPHPGYIRVHHQHAVNLVRGKLQDSQAHLRRPPTEADKE